MKRTLNVLFLCTGNSARSIIAEAILNDRGAHRFKGFSAGSHPKGEVHPVALKLLNDLGHDTFDLHAKSWDAFAGPGAPKLDVIITVCDRAAAETCPVWPGHPASAHWGMPDPVTVAGGAAEAIAVFADTYRLLANRISAFVELPIASLGTEALKQRLTEIGERAKVESAVRNPNRKRSR